MIQVMFLATLGGFTSAAFALPYSVPGALLAYVFGAAFVALIPELVLSLRSHKASNRVAFHKKPPS
jgi:hypothetical protein